MTPLQLANFLQAAAVAVVALLVGLWMVATIRLDCLRQKLFALRDQMFDYALAGNISFEDPAYVQLRNLMNGLIRYGHYMTITRSIFSLLSRWAGDTMSKHDWNDSWAKSVQRLHSEEVKKRMNRFHDDAMKITIKHIVSGSPVLLVVIIVAVGWLVLRNFTKGTYISLRHLARLVLPRMMKGPLDPREIEKDAMCFSEA
jgi:hypothetical protein